MGQCHVPPDYFLFTMSQFEANAILVSYNNKFKNDWERTRWLAYILLQPHTDKLKKPEDLVLFNWEDIPKLTNDITSENIKEIKNDLLKVAGVL